MIDIGDEPRLFRLPVERRPGARARVRALEVGTSKPANIANQPKCSAASSGDFETTGIFRRRPITSAIALNGTPSSAT
ncbi:MAG TPA: hypothetical protein VK542_09395, partial [Gemmatimonadaceae bacterium]|nr:hypothetical protein [Gemmatimonadaceae bacterium]